MNLKSMVNYSNQFYRVEQITSVRTTAKSEKKVEKHFKPLTEFIEVFFVVHS